MSELETGLEEFETAVETYIDDWQRIHPECVTPVFFAQCRDSVIALLRSYCRNQRRRAELDAQRRQGIDRLRDETIAEYKRMLADDKNRAEKSNRLLSQAADTIEALNRRIDQLEGVQSE